MGRLIVQAKHEEILFSNLSSKVPKKNQTVEFFFGKKCYQYPNSNSDCQKTFRKFFTKIWPFAKAMKSGFYNLPFLGPFQKFCHISNPVEPKNFAKPKNTQWVDSVQQSRCPWIYVCMYMSPSYASLVRGLVRSVPGPSLEP